MNIRTLLALIVPVTILLACAPPLNGGKPSEPAQPADAPTDPNAAANADAPTAKGNPNDAHVASTYPAEVRGDLLRGSFGVRGLLT